jgi:hypothetical protein
MNDLLKPLLDKEVEVRSISGNTAYRDEGKLVAYEERWIQIQTSSGETLLFPIANVRLLKPLYQS